MPIDVTPYLDPATCAVVNMECQENLIGPDSVLPGLARAAAEVGLVDHVAALLAAARRVGTCVYYCTDTRRDDGFGRATNTFVHVRMPARRSTDRRPGRGRRAPHAA